MAAGPCPKVENAAFAVEGLEGQLQEWNPSEW